MANTKNDAPLFKIERSETPIGKHSHLIFLGVGLVVAIAVYTAGIILKMPFLTGLALFIGMIAIVGYLIFKRKFGIASEIDMDEELKKYRADLIDTFNGYEVEYTQEEINKAVDEYREMLERETASVSDLDVSTMSQVISDNIKNRKDKKAAKKSKKSKKNNSKSAYDENGNIIKLRDLD